MSRRLGEDIVLHTAVIDDSSTALERVASADGDYSGCRELTLGFGRKNLLLWLTHRPLLAVRDGECV